MTDVDSSSPDAHSSGFLDKKVDPLRYDFINPKPEEVAGILRLRMPSAARVLDVGCGTGSLTAFVNDGKRNTVVGLEPDPTRADAARMKGIDVSAQLLDAEFVRNKGLFDVVMLADVLEHVADSDSFFRLCLSSLKPRGLVLISVPNVAHWTVRYDLLMGRFDYQDSGIRDATHLRWFTQKTLLNFITGHDMKILSVEQTMGADLSDYYHRWPWRNFSYDRRYKTLRFLLRYWPRLFGCQHIVVAEKNH